MNKKSIETAKDPKLRSSFAALKQSAQDARRIAAQTGTSIVVVVDGKIVHIKPSLDNGQHDANHDG